MDNIVVNKMYSSRKNSVFMQKIYTAHRNTYLKGFKTNSLPDFSIYMHTVFTHLYINRWNI